MNRTEALEFLDLSDLASTKEINDRLTEKMQYFSHLLNNAPNGFLRRIHEENLLKLESIRTLLGIKNAEHPQPEANSVPKRIDIYDNRVESAGNPAETSAWLVRHTENQPTKVYPLYPGRNVVGRAVQPFAKTILIEDDFYISNIHTVLEVQSVNPLRILVTDDAFSNHGKPSRNGTYINGSEKRIVSPTYITENDTVQIGYTKLLVRLNNATVQKLVREVENSEYMKTVVINIY